MISIVICSKISIPDPNLSKNIFETIGNLKYEIIWIDNSKNEYNIFSAYNLGISKSKYAIICFIHQDIEFKTYNWGKIVINCFNNNKVGLCGVIGSKYISPKPFGWWCSLSKRGRIYEIIDNQIKLTDYGEKFGEEVVVIDGLCMFFRKSLYPLIRFDENTYNGFHFYDMDICMQVLLRDYMIKLVPIDILHKSRGYANLKFYTNYIKFTNKYKNVLPIFIDINHREYVINERYFNTYKPVNRYEQILFKHERLFIQLDKIGTFLRIKSFLSRFIFVIFNKENIIENKIKRHLS